MVAGVAETDLMDDIINAVVTYQTPEQYMIGTVLIGAFMSFLCGAVYIKKAYNDHLKKYGLSKAECPFGASFAVAVIVITILGGFLGYFGAGVFLGMADQQGAPDMVYYFVAFLIGIVVGQYGIPFLQSVCDIIADRLKIKSSGDNGKPAAETDDKATSVAVAEPATEAATTPAQVISAGGPVQNQ